MTDDIVKRLFRIYRGVQKSSASRVFGIQCAKGQSAKCKVAGLRAQCAKSNLLTLVVKIYMSTQSMVEKPFETNSKEQFYQNND